MIRNSWPNAVGGRIYASRVYPLRDKAGIRTRVEQEAYIRDQIDETKYKEKKKTPLHDGETIPQLIDGSHVTCVVLHCSAFDIFFLSLSALRQTHTPQTHFFNH